MPAMASVPGSAPPGLGGDQRILVSLLIQIGFMACLASLLVTTRFYKRLLRQQTLHAMDCFWFALSWSAGLVAGVGARFSLNYAAADLSLPGTMLAGLFAGPGAGLMTGVLAGGAAAARGEWLALPFFAI